MVGITNILQTNVLNQEKDPHRITNFNSFINQYEWKEINIPAEPKGWKMFETNNKANAPIFLPNNEE